jgi:hypothetical protein
VEAGRGGRGRVNDSKRVRYVTRGSERARVRGSEAASKGASRPRRLEGGARADRQGEPQQGRVQSERASERGKEGAREGGREGARERETERASARGSVSEKRVGATLPRGPMAGIVPQAVCAVQQGRDGSYVRMSTYNRK